MNPRTKDRLKTLASFLGWTTRDYGRRRSTMKQFCRHLVDQGFEPSAILDVGVADGTFEIYTEFPRSRYLLIEPLRDFVPALDWIVAHYDAQYELVAAGTKEGCHDIYFGDSMATKHGASLLPSESNEQDTKSSQILVRRLDKIVKDHGLKGPMLLKIDTQGTELDVIESAEGVLSDIEVIILETSFFKFDTEQPLFVDVLNFMAKKGFYPYDFFGGFNRPFDNALGQIDVAFVKTEGQFRNDHRYASGLEKRPLPKAMLQKIRKWLNV